MLKNIFGILADNQSKATLATLSTISDLDALKLPVKNCFSVENSNESTEVSSKEH